jgi:hypothetical protein
VLVEKIDIPFIYAKGDLAAASEKLKQLSDPPATPDDVFTLELEQGKLPAVPETVHPYIKPYWLLCRSLAANKQGNAEEAKASRTAALEMMKDGDGTVQAVAKILANPTEAKFEDANDLIFNESQKAIFLVALASEAPQIRAQCLELAEKLNSELEFPHHLLKAIITDLRTKQ